MDVRSFGYIGFESPDAKAWEDFGPRILGLQLADPGPDGAVRLRVDDRAHRISVHPGDRNRMTYMGWELPTLDDLNTADAELRAAGVAFERFSPELAAERKVSDGLVLHDPSGLRHELFTGQLSAPATFRPGRRASGFVTGEQGLGHAVLIVPDLAAALDFWTGLMGFRVSDTIDTPMIKLTFLHCNRRHHTLALGEVPKARGLQHLMLQVESVDDVGICLDLCEANDVPLSLTLGRHTNDRMLSFYLRTPSGFDLEYGWGGIEIDEEAWTVSSYDSPSIWGHKFVATEPFGAIELVE